MEIQGTHIDNGARILVIDQACDNDQLLVSLSKNGAQWLSPVGWTDQQKVTLLECRANGDTTQIDIPSEFAKDIKSGDVLVLRCSELDIEKEITWESSEIETREQNADAPAATGLASGLLSRFKTPKAEPVKSLKSETELRADEARRAAENFKAKMEAATAAKEEAQRKSLNAAREAEAALKMEAERITEMERAAKAFEEAERLKQDEMRRVEEERRIEEARLAEEARRIEEARKREIAAKKEADRKAALKRYVAALDITRDEELRLKDRLKTLKQQAKVNAENTAVQTEDLDSRRDYLVTTEESALKRAESHQKSALKLDGIMAALSIVQNEADTLNADRQALTERLAQADTDYQTAQSEAEAAIARAETKRAELETIRGNDLELSNQMSSISEKLSSQSLAALEATEKTQKLHLKSETAQAELAQAKLEIEALEGSLQTQAENDQNLRLETEATQQAIEDSQARELSHCEAIDHLEAGGDPEAISDIISTPRSYEADLARNDSENDLASLPPAEESEAGLFNRVRRSFSREKDAKISIDVDDVVLEAADLEADPALLAGSDNTPSFARRHGSSLMALGAVIGGIAILGGSLALNKSAPSNLEVKSSTPAPTQVAGVVTKVELPKAIEAEQPAEVEAGADVEAALPDTELTEAAPEAVEKASLSDVEPPKPEVSLQVEDLITPIKAVAVPAVVKTAELVEPTGFAFELPDMMPERSPKRSSAAASSKKDATAPAVKKAISKTAVRKKADKTKAETIQLAAVKNVKPAVTEAKIAVVTPEPATLQRAKAVTNYPELTKDIQTRLSGLGFYSGDINGLQTLSTKEAITNFKTLFDMGVDDKINAELLMALKRAESDQAAAQLVQAAQAEAEAQAAIQLAEAAPSIQFYDTVQAVPSTPVVTDSLPAASDPVPAYVAPEVEPVKVASIAAITEAAPTPVEQDIIVEAVTLKNAVAKYPSSALRRNYFVNVAIVVAYDIGSNGKAANIRIESNDHAGRYNVAFEKEAIKAVKGQRFEPKTVNGVPVVSEGKQKRIVFRAE
ncbi:MAG: energy transducer TonB [Hellea sp.]